MTHAFLLCILLYIIFPHSSSAGPRSTAPLPRQVQAKVPRCAQKCLRTFIAKNFPLSACRDPQNLQCLCTKQSQTGYTLGESALTCVATDCSDTVFQSNKFVYGICLGVNDARPMTHKTLTASQVLTSIVTSTPKPSPKERNGSMTSDDRGGASEIPFSSTVTETDIEPSITSDSGSPTDGGTTISDLDTRTTDESTTSFDTTSLISATSTASFSSLTALSSPTSDFPIASDTSPTSSSSSTRSATPVPVHSLSKGQVAGVAVAGVASASLAFGLLLFFFCLRRRKPNRRDSDASFGNDKEVVYPRNGLPPPSHVLGQSDPARLRSAEQAPQSQHNEPPTNRKSNRWSLFKRVPPPEEIGVAIAPGPKTPLMADAEPPMTAATYHSQILPDAPYPSIFPQHRGFENEVSPISPVDQWERFPDPVGYGSSELQGPSHRKAPQAPSELDATPLVPQTGLVPLRLSTSDPILQARRDRGSTFNPTQDENGNPATWTRSMDTLRKPSAALVQTREPLRASRGSMSQVQNAPFYASTRSTSTAPASALSQLPSQQRRTSLSIPNFPPPPSTTRRKPSISRRSTNSETEFEDTDSDEDESHPLPIMHPNTSSATVVPSHPNPSASIGQQRFHNAAAALQNSQITPQTSNPTTQPPLPSSRRVPRQYIPPSLTPSLAPSSRGFTTTTITARRNHSRNGSRSDAPPPPPLPPPSLPRLTTRPVSPPTDVAELQGSAVSDARRETIVIPTTASTGTEIGMSPQSDRDVRRSARWKILVGSGEGGID